MKLRFGRVVRVAVVAVSVVVSILLTELALRASGYQYSPLHVEVQSQTSDWRDQHAFHDRDFVYDPVLIWRPKGGPFSAYNPQGFRGVPVAADKPKGTFRIFALGDSNTFGWSNDDGVNWPAQLQRLAIGPHPNAEVVNAGVWGYTSFQGARRFKELLPYSPDLVLVSFGANDAHQVSVADTAYVGDHARAERWAKVTAKFRTAQLVTGAWERLGVAIRGKANLVSRVSVEEYKANLRGIIQQSRERHVTPVLLTRPFIGTSTDPGWWKTHAPRYNAAVLELAKAEGVLAVDVFSAFHDRPELFDDESHFGVEGHRLAAELIYGAIAPLIH